MRAKTPDQIRRDTTPNKHYALTYGFLGGFLSAALSFGTWGLFHQEQIMRYPDYLGYAAQTSMDGLSLFGGKPTPGMSKDHLRYNLLRFGNEDHQFDAEIVRRGWYPKGVNGRAWVFYHGAVKPLYSDRAALVFKWPLTLTLLGLLGSIVLGLVADYRYHSAVMAGVPFDGSVVATVKEYEKEVKGDGMAYVVNPWKDR